MELPNKPKPITETNETKEPIPKENETNIYQALADFTMDAPVLTKKAVGHNYKYVDLTEIVQIIKPILAKHNLVVVQTLKGPGILTELVHTLSLSKIESYCDIPQNVTLPGQNPYQAYGSAITYFRRYQYTTILGLVSDDDVDSKVAKTGKAKLTKEKFDEAKEYFDKGEVTLDEIMGKYTLTQAQKQELLTKYH